MGPGTTTMQSICSENQMVLHLQSTLCNTTNLFQSLRLQG